METTENQNRFHDYYQLANPRKLCCCQARILNANNSSLICIRINAMRGKINGTTVRAAMSSQDDRKWSYMHANLQASQRSEYVGRTSSPSICYPLGRHCRVEC